MSVYNGSQKQKRDVCYDQAHGVSCPFREAHSDFDGFLQSSLRVDKGYSLDQAVSISLQESEEYTIKSQSSASSTLKS